MFSKAELYCQDVMNIAGVELPWHKLKNKTLLLTGASGLIGTFFIDVLMKKMKRINWVLRFMRQGAMKRQREAVLPTIGIPTIFLF